MKHLLLLALLTVGVACSKHRRSEPRAAYVPPADAYDTMRMEPPTSVPIQYVAWCHLEKSAVGVWVDSADFADTNRRAHMDSFPDHECCVLWRQRPK